MRRARALLKPAFRSAASLPLAARGGLDIEEFAGRSKPALEVLCRARAQPVYLGENEALCRILGRYKLYVDTRDKGLCAHPLLDGHWEMGLTMHIARHARAGMTAIDVGANFGYCTVPLGALVGEGGHVLAIEPPPEALLFVPEREPKNAQIVASPDGLDHIPGIMAQIPIQKTLVMMYRPATLTSAPLNKKVSNIAN